MPKIKMLTSMGGLNFSYSHGEELEVSKEVAKAWIDAGIAELVEVTTKKITTKKGDK